jgi:hypothetical protein
MLNIDPARARSAFNVTTVFLPVMLVALASRVQRSVILADQPLAFVESLRPEVMCYAAASLLSIAFITASPRLRGLRFAMVAFVAWFAFIIEFLSGIAWASARTVIDPALLLYGVENASMLSGFLIALGGDFALGAQGAVMLYLAICGRVFLRECGDGPRMTDLVVPGLVCLALGLPGGLAVEDTLLGRNAVVSLVAGLPALAEVPPAPTDASAYAKVALVPDPSATAKPYDHVALIWLESVGWRATSLDGEGPATTPVMERLAADGGWLAERTYVVMAHSTKASVPLFCGFEPRPIQAVRESLPGRLPYRCLPRLLADQGFETLMLRSATEQFEGWTNLIAQVGFQTFLPLERLPQKGFRWTNYFGVEEEIMLGPGREWLASRVGGRTMVAWQTGAPHHEYDLPEDRVLQDYHPEEDRNKYLNAVTYVDGFIEDVIGVYRDLGVLDRTLFVFVGDHGEAFDEHKLRAHDGVPFDEVARVPLLFWAEEGLTPQRFTGLASQLDVVPTIEALLGYRAVGAERPGFRLDQLPEQRTLFGACWHMQRCAWKVTKTAKDVHFFGHRPDARFDLTKDPDERSPLPSNATPEILAWQREIEARFLGLDPK